VALTGNVLAADDAATPGSAVTIQDLARFAEVFSDLGDTG
jgi:hypothetical protein